MKIIWYNKTWHKHKNAKLNPKGLKIMFQEGNVYKDSFCYYNLLHSLVETLFISQNAFASHTHYLKCLYTICKNIL